MRFRFFKVLFCFFISFFIGSKLRILVLRHVLGYEIALDSSVGVCFVDVESLKVGSGCVLGSFTVIRNVSSVCLEENSRIGSFNWIFGRRGVAESSLVLRDGSSITSRHLIDCSSKVELGRFSIVAGYRTQILTHSIDINLSEQLYAPVSIGEYCFIGSGSILLKGSYFPSHSALGAGSVYSGSGQGEFKLYAGNRARAVKEFDSQAKFFNRTKARV